MDEQLRLAILERLDEGKLACGQAFAIARQWKIEPIAVGLAANDAEVRISRCQLGLFGYGPKAGGKHKIVQPMDEVPADLVARLREAASGRGISCAAVWQVADSLGYSRLEASGAVEALALKVSHCQLGCFPRP